MICFDIFILIRCPVRNDGIIEPKWKDQLPIDAKLFVKPRLPPIERAESNQPVPNSDQDHELVLSVRHQFTPPTIG